jgi:hypothetical protein
MAASTAHKAAKEKAAKQRKMLLVLMLPLGLSGFYAYHTLAKAHQSSSSAPPPAATTTSTSPASTAPGSTTASPVPAAAPGVVQAPDGKLTSFALLRSRDPFSGAVGESSPSIPAIPPPQPVQPKPQPVKPKPVQPQPVKPQPKKSQPKETQPVKPQKKKLGPPPKTAVLSYDGMLIEVRLHKTFGEAPVSFGEPPQPLFWVVTLTHKTARIVVVGKQRAKTLKVDVPLTLADLNGTLHTLMLLPQGTPLPPAPGVATASTTSTNGSRGG